MSSQQRKYICSFCSKGFSRSEHRARHERSHTGMKPFECKVCKHAFVRRDLLQRHIRTVHRELLLMEKDKERDDTKSDIFIELLVNSMIKVSKQEGNRLGREKAEILSQWLNGFLPKCELGAEVAEKIFGCGLKYVERRMPSEFAARVAAQLFGPINRTAHVQQFMQLCTSTPLVLAISALGAYSCGDSRGADLWHVCWSSCLKTSSSDRYLSLNLLVFAALAFDIKANHVDLSSVYQYTCYAVMVNNLYNEEFPEKWTVFHQLVTLLRSAETYTELTQEFYEWFEKQELVVGRTLKECLITLDGSRDTIVEAVFLGWVIGYNNVSLDKAFSLFSRIDESNGSSHLVVLESYWLLLETAWFQFIKGLERSGFYTSSRMGWFRNCYVRGPEAKIRTDHIDELFMKTVLSVLVSMDHKVGPFHVALVTDVVLFLLRFAQEMDSNIMMDNKNKNGQNLICILQRRASTNQVSSFTDSKNDIVSYLRGAALVLANLPFVKSDIRVPLMVAVQGSPLLTRKSQRSDDSQSPEGFSSPTSSCNCSVTDEKPASEAYSNSGCNVMLPPLQVKQGSHVARAPFTAPPFITRKAENPTPWSTSRFNIKLPPPGELFHIS